MMRTPGGDRREGGRDGEGRRCPQPQTLECALVGRGTFLAPHVPDRTISRNDVGIIDTVNCNTLFERN